MLFLTAFAMAQERNYISTCGKTKTAIKWTEEHKDGKIYLHTVQGGEKHEYILGSGYKNRGMEDSGCFIKHQSDCQLVQRDIFHIRQVQWETDFKDGEK